MNNPLHWSSDSTRDCGFAALKPGTIANCGNFVMPREETVDRQFRITQFI